MPAGRRRSLPHAMAHTMKEKKYFFFDLDGTLSVGRERFVPESTRFCLQRLRDNGHFVSVATGRLQKDAFDFVAPLGVCSLVADGGNSVTLDGVIREMRSLPPVACRAFLRWLDDRHIPWAVTTENKVLCLTRDERFAGAVKDVYFPLIVDRAFSYAGQRAFYKIYVPCAPGREGEIDFHGLPVVRYSEECVFIEPVDKGNGIKKLMRLLQADIHDVVVFGDGGNDVGMFLPDWFSVAMGNAGDALKRKADYVTTACDEDGIFKACAHFGWV